MCPFVAPHASVSQSRNRTSVRNPISWPASARDLLSPVALASTDALHRCFHVPGLVKHNIPPPSPGTYFVVDGRRLEQGQQTAVRAEIQVDQRVHESLARRSRSLRFSSVTGINSPSPILSILDHAATLERASRGEQTGGRVESHAIGTLPGVRRGHEPSRCPIDQVDSLARVGDSDPATVGERSRAASPDSSSVGHTTSATRFRSSHRLNSMTILGCRDSELPRRRATRRGRRTRHGRPGYSPASGACRQGTIGSELPLGDGDSLALFGDGAEP